MYRIAILVTGLTIWGLALFGVLQIGLLAGAGGHAHGAVSICGPWGCGPPVSALVAMHGFWTLLAMPPLGLISQTWQRRHVHQLGRILWISAAVVIAGVVLWQTFIWWPTANRLQRPYIVHRCLFSLVMLVDLPVLPALLGGITLCAMSRQPKDPSGVQTVTADSMPAVDSV